MFTSLSFDLFGEVGGSNVIYLECLDFKKEVTNLF